MLYENSKNLHPIDIPAPTRPGTYRLPAFTLNYPGLYVIDYRLLVQDQRQNKLLTCALGIDEDWSKPCPKGRTIAGASWFLRHDGAIVAHGEQRPWRESGRSADDVSAGIGEFEAGSSQGTSYELEVTIYGDLGRLAPLHPRLIVDIHPRSWMIFYVGGVLAMLFAFLVAPFGIWKLLSGATESVQDVIADRRWKSRK
jgi:hypothetical protein